LRPISASTDSSISRNSIGTLVTVISDLVTTAAVTRLMASIGSSEMSYETSRSMYFRPWIRSVVVPMPSISTPRVTR
jgi:hypothetical protein